MGTAITELLKSKEIRLEDLHGKKLAVDGQNQLYMFLSNIRQADGSLLMDSKGQVTSHLMGILNRFSNILENGIKPVFVFDGETPKLKHAERERRKGIKIEAQKKFEEAKQKEDLDEMKKYAARTSRLTSEMIEEAKALIKAMGMPIVQAPTEGEAQAAYMAQKGDVYAVMSQDADCFLFGAPRLIKNLTISRRRKKIGTQTYKTMNPEMVSLADNLNELQLQQDQLIVLAMLVGTDFNVGGIKGLGPKKSLSLVKKFGTNFEPLFKEAKWDDFFDYPWKTVFDLLKNMGTTDNYELEWSNPDSEAMYKILVEKHDFGEERVKNVIEKMCHGKDKQQKGLGDFF
ncbi:MAG: flap endonuclease-1 [archaeon]